MIPVLMMVMMTMMGIITTTHSHHLFNNKFNFLSSVRRTIYSCWLVVADSCNSAASCEYAEVFPINCLSNYLVCTQSIGLQNPAQPSERYYQAQPACQMPVGGSVAVAKRGPPAVVCASGSVVANGRNLPHTLPQENWQNDRRVKYRAHRKGCYYVKTQLQHYCSKFISASDGRRKCTNGRIDCNCIGRIELCTITVMSHGGGDCFIMGKSTVFGLQNLFIIIS